MMPVNILMFEEIDNIQRELNLKDFNFQRRVMRNNSNLFNLDDIEFKNTFRLNKQAATDLITSLSPFMRQSLHPNALSPEVKIFTALLFFASGSYQRLIGQSYNISMSQASVSNCVKEVSSLIYQHLKNDFIKFPTSDQEKNLTKEGFMERYRFPGVIGAIDCTQIKILAPSVEEHNYVNRKGFHSKNVQIICDHRCKIFNINAIYPGSTHDSFIWRNSQINEYLKNCYLGGDKSSWLLGDSGYPLQPWLITPIIDAPEGSPEERFTRRHCSARSTVERCIGILKARFRCLLGERSLRYSPSQVGIIVVSCAVLHNMCLNNDDINLDIVPENEVNVGQNEGQIIDNLEEGRRTRVNIINRYFQN